MLRLKLMHKPMMTNISTITRFSLYVFLTIDCNKMITITPSHSPYISCQESSMSCFSLPLGLVLPLTSTFTAVRYSISIIPSSSLRSTLCLPLLLSDSSATETKTADVSWSEAYQKKPYFFSRFEVTTGHHDEGPQYIGLA